MNTKELPISVRDEIENVLDEFDFATVHKVMEFLEWNWFGAMDGIPTLSEIRKSARRLLIEVANDVARNNEIDAQSNRATGGLRAEAYKGDEKTYLKLSFELAEWDNYE